MKYLCCLFLLGMPLASRAQQSLCERELRANAPQYFSAPLLLRLQPDSLRLLSNYLPNSPNGSYLLQTRLTRVNSVQCDTLPTRTGSLALRGSGAQDNVAAVTRRGQVLIAKAVPKLLPTGATDSIRIVLRLLSRDGTIQWQRFLPPQARFEGISGIVEAPENGFFLVGGESHPALSGPGRAYAIVLRIDSAGRELWRRRYSPALNGGLENPTYTRSGTFVCTTDFTASGASPRLTLTEFNQRGDSLTSRQIVITQQQATRVPFYNVPNSLIPLRDGGFALVGRVDSANTGYFRPFLARLDRNLNLTWSHVHRPQATQDFRFAQPRELADGSLVVVASNYQSGRGFPFWLFRFSATGQLTNSYPFVSQVLTPNTNGGRNGFFGVAQGLQPLSDSTFMVVAGSADLNSSRIYLAHLRVPGLPRVLDNHLVPAADPLATRAPATAWPGAAAYPNPAADLLTLPYRLPPGTRAARLLVHDALGRPVHQQALDPRQPQATLPVATWPPGLYLFTLLVDGQVLGRQRVAVSN